MKYEALRILGEHVDKAACEHSLDYELDVRQVGGGRGRAA